jgi:hypothetical protein
MRRAEEAVEMADESGESSSFLLAFEDLESFEISRSFEPRRGSENTISATGGRKRCSCLMLP